MRGTIQQATNGGAVMNNEIEVGKYFILEGERLQICRVDHVNEDGHLDCLILDVESGRLISVVGTTSSLLKICQECGYVSRIKQRAMKAVVDRINQF